MNDNNKIDMMIIGNTSTINIAISYLLQIVFFASIFFPIFWIILSLFFQNEWLYICLFSITILYILVFICSVSKKVFLYIKEKSRPLDYIFYKAIGLYLFLIYISLYPIFFINIEYYYIVTGISSGVIVSGGYLLYFFYEKKINQSYIIGELFPLKHIEGNYNPTVSMNIRVKNIGNTLAEKLQVRVKIKDIGSPYLFWDTHGDKSDKSINLHPDDSFRGKFIKFYPKGVLSQYINESINTNRGKYNLSNFKIDVYGSKKNLTPETYEKYMKDYNNNNFVDYLKGVRTKINKYNIEWERDIEILKRYDFTIIISSKNFTKTYNETISIKQVLSGRWNKEAIEGDNKIKLVIECLDKYGWSKDNKFGENITLS